MGFFNKKKQVTETVSGSNVIISDTNGEETLLTTYVSKDDCAPAKNMDKFISNAVKLSDKVPNTKVWVLSNFSIDEEINKAILSSGSTMTFSDEIALSGITNVRKKKKMEVK